MLALLALFRLGRLGGSLGSGFFGGLRGSLFRSLRHGFGLFGLKLRPESLFGFGHGLLHFISDGAILFLGGFLRGLIEAGLQLLRGFFLCSTP